MDCDKFEDIMLDELYGELDELTSAAAKRHMAGCARCSALLGGLRATRRVATLPVVAPSPGFDERLLAAVREAEVTAKPAIGLAQVISWAGRWAMRPQTAMAAVFLLMVGTSSVLFSRHAPKSAMEVAPASFTVTENGVPAAPSPASAPPMEDQALDPAAAAAAHGAAGPLSRAPAPSMMKPTFARGPSSSGPEGAGGSAERLASSDGIPARAQAYPAAHSARQAPGGYGLGALGGAANNQAADISPPVVPAAAGFAAPPPAPAPREGARDSLADERVSAIASARTERDSGGGCSVAVGEFDTIAASAWGTAAGYDATFEGAQCYARMGQTDAARSRFDRLLTVPAYASRAQAGINATSMVAAKARAAPSKPAATRAEDKPATAPAAAAPASPAATPASQ
jgi:hypothetical protein